MINQIDRITKKSIIKMFTDQLGYVYYGNWEKREHNSNVELGYLEQFLEKQLYLPTLVKKTA
jgi:type I restriction enzyme R subunit